MLGVFKHAGIVLIAVFLVFSSLSYAYAPPEVCSSNGYWDGSDCQFIRDPVNTGSATENKAHCFNGYPVPCEGGLAKYRDACAGNDFYDYAGSTYVFGTWFNHAAGRCEYSNSPCYASISRNDPRCVSPVYIEPAQLPSYGERYSYSEEYTFAPSYSYPAYPSYSYPSYSYPSFPIDTYYSTCVLSAYPSSIKAGESTTVSIYYYDLPYSLPFMTVQCGNGRIGTSFGCFGTTGICFATCHYPNPGDFTISGFADGIFCYPGSVSVSDRIVPIVYPPQQPPPLPPQPAPVTNFATPSCSISATPSTVVGGHLTNIKVFYHDFSKAPAVNLVNCGNGESPTLACSLSAPEGYCDATCDYGEETTYPQAYAVSAVLNGTLCSQARVNVVSPSTLNGNLRIRVSDCSTGNVVSGAKILVESQAYYTGSMGEATVSNLAPGEKTVVLSKEGYRDYTTTARVESSKTNTVNLCLNSLNSRCALSIGASSVRPSETLSVNVNYFSFAAVPSSASIDCGDGNTKSAACTGTAEEGTCSAACTYTDYPRTRTVSSSINLRNCGSASINVIAPSPTTGSVLAKAVDASTGSVLVGARVTALNMDYFTDGYGNVVIPGLAPGSVALNAVASGYDAVSASANVSIGSTTTILVRMQKSAPVDSCDFSTELVGSGECSRSPSYSIIVKNKLAETNNVTISATSPLFVSSYWESIPGDDVARIDVHADVSSIGTGTDLGYVTIKSSACTKNIRIPVCVSGGIKITPVEIKKTGFPGSQLCYDFRVENSGNKEGVVTMILLDGVGSDRFSEPTIDNPTFNILSFESRDARVCTKVASGASAGLGSLILEARLGNEYSNLAVIELEVPSGFEVANMTDCPSISTGTNYALSITNNALGGDYYVEFQNAGDLEIVSNPSIIQNFQKGTTRTVYLRLNPLNKVAGSYNPTLVLKGDGAIAFQKELCFQVLGERRSDIRLLPSDLNIQTCSGQATLLSIKNIGTVEERYVVKSDSTQVQVSIDPESIVLKPGEEGRISVFVKGKSNTPTGDYVIPIKVYYDGGYYYYNYTPYYTRNVEVSCGNGNKQTVYCNGGSGSCSVDCYYSSQGIYTVTSGIGGTTCKSTQVNVGDSYASCAISASPHYLDSGSSTSITLNYKNLPYLPGTVSIDCGNGGTTSVDCSSSLPFNATFRITNTDGNSDILTLRKGETSQGFGFSIYVIALYKKGFYYHANISISNQSSADIDLTPGDSVTSANGVNVTLLGINPSTSATSGSCVGSCYYSSSGFYTVTASMSGVTCNPTLVNSGPQVSSCALSASPYSVSPGGYSTISLNYFGAYNIDSYQRYSSTRYYDGPVTTQNLLVHVTPGCGTGFVPPTVSPAGIEISSIAGDALSSTGEIRLGIALKNNNNYPIDAVQLRVINLPSNVYATSSTVSLDALREKTAFIYLRSEGVKEGSYRIKVIAESSLGYAEKEFTLQVFPKGEKIDAVISEPRISISRQDSKTRMDIAFPITNNEEFPLRLSGYFTSLPSGWEYSVEPALLTANPKQTANFTATIIARSPEAREYMGVFVVKSTDGRTSSTPFTLAIREGFPLTGLFVFATSEPFLIALLVFMFAVAGYLIYASRKNIEELRKRSEAEASEKPPSAGRRRLYL